MIRFWRGEAKDGVRELEAFEHTGLGDEARQAFAFSTFIALLVLMIYRLRGKEMRDSGEVNKSHLKKGQLSVGSAKGL